MERKIWQVYCLGKGEGFQVSFEGVQRGFLSERKGKVIPCRWTGNAKGAGTNSGESGARNLEVESIRSRAESTGGCVNLKIVADIRCTLLLLSTLVTPCGEFGSFNYILYCLRRKIMATQAVQNVLV